MLDQRQSKQSSLDLGSTTHKTYNTHRAAEDRRYYSVAGVSHNPEQLSSPYWISSSPSFLSFSSKRKQGNSTKFKLRSGGRLQEITVAVCK